MNFRLVFRKETQLLSQLYFLKYKDFMNQA